METPLAKWPTNSEPPRPRDSSERVPLPQSIGRRSFLIQISTRGRGEGSGFSLFFFFFFPCLTVWRNARLRFGTLDDDIAVQAIIFLAIRSYPRFSSRELLDKLRQVPGLEDLTESFLSRTISSWDYNWGRAEQVADFKFTEENTRDWILYAFAILDIPLDRVRRVEVELCS